MAELSPINGITYGCHPNLLAQQVRDPRSEDKLRRMALRHSYETRSLSGVRINNTQTCMPTSSSLAEVLQDKRLSPLHLEQHRRGGKPISPASLLCLEGRHRQSDILTARPREDVLASLKRSSSHSSVAVSRTTPTSHSGSSSYVLPSTSNGRHDKLPRISQSWTRYENVGDTRPAADALRSSSCCSGTGMCFGSVCAKSRHSRHGILSPLLKSKSSENANCSHIHGTLQAKDEPDAQMTWNRGSKHLAVSHDSTWHHKASDECPGTNIKAMEPHYYPRLFKYTGNSQKDPERCGLQNISKSSPSLRKAVGNIPHPRLGTIPSLPGQASVSPLKPSSQPAATATHDRRISLHTPKGKKLASLV